MQKDETDSTEYKNGSFSFKPKRYMEEKSWRKTNERKTMRKGCALMEQLTLMLKWILLKSWILPFGSAVSVAASAATETAMENADMRSFSPTHYKLKVN